VESALTKAQRENGEAAIVLLQRLATSMNLVRRGIVLDDEGLVRLFNDYLAGLVEPNPNEVNAVRQLISFCGDDPNREGLQETPERYLKALQEYTQGYQQDPREVIKTFEDGAEGYDEMILQRNIPFHSLCEHHIAPFYGKVHIGYVPGTRIVGLSKLARLTDIFARRFQVQERLTCQIADALEEHLGPRGVGVVVEATNLCIECRGVKKIGSTTTTSAMRGVFRDKPEARAEFFALVNR
jgi:GTP cyclohydrolase I